MQHKAETQNSSKEPMVMASVPAVPWHNMRTDFHLTREDYLVAIDDHATFQVGSENT